MSVQPEINYVLVPPRLRWVDVSPRWYLELLAQPEVALSLFNSFVVSISVTVLCLVFGALGAYPLARLKSSRKKYILKFECCKPNDSIHGADHPDFSIIENNGAVRHPARANFSLHSASSSLRIMDAQKLSGASPTRFGSAALMDGCTRLGALFRVMIPAIAPGVVATGAFAFIGAWNEFLLV